MRRRVLTLPYPPSVNRCWRHVGPRVLVSREGRSYRERVRSLLAASGITPSAGRLHVSVTLHPPDRRPRDLDNPMKSLLDAMGRGAAYDDDSQVDRLTVERGEPVAGGACVVEIVEVPA